MSMETVISLIAAATQVVIVVGAIIGLYVKLTNKMTITAYIVETLKKSVEKIETIASTLISHTDRHDERLTTVEREISDLRRGRGWIQGDHGIPWRDDGGHG